MQPEQSAQQNPDSDDIVPPSDFKEPKAKKSKKGHKSDEDSHWHRFLDWYKADKRKSIPLTVLALVLLVALVPWSRYHAAGLVLKQDFRLQVIDSKTHTPVSGAQVSIGSTSGTTDGSGKVTLRSVPVGRHTASVIKKYYLDERISVLVPIMRQKSQPSVSFMATGRQVKIITTDLISKQKLSGVDIEVADIKAKTDKKGEALIVVPTGVSSEKVKLSFKDYNDANATIQVSDKEIKENTLNLTPAGKIYFLSKLSGKIDVVKTNLDGSDRKTVLGGTGKEDDRGTVLLASRDWKYLALLSKREGAQKLYIITTDDDRLLTMDEGDADFNPTGWSGHYFVFSVDRHGYPNGRPYAHALKSYNAESGKMLTLDQTNASGSTSYDYAWENYGTIYLTGSDVIYNKTWDNNYYSSPSTLNGKQDYIYSIGADGSGSRTLKSFDSLANQYINSIPYEASSIYYIQHSTDDQVSYFAYDNGKIVAKDKSIGDEFNNYQANTYLQSPSGKDTFWVESRDGKNALFIGDQDGENGKQIASLSEYRNYGWFTDDYLLVSKKDSELYIISRGGLKKDSEAVKVTDYHKPSRTFYGYGGGYGGL